MVSIAVAQPNLAARRLQGIGVLAVAGLALVALGAFLPWVSIYAGLTPIPGYLLDGGALAGVAVAAAGMLLASERLGGGRVLRPLALLAAAAVVADALYSAWRIRAYVADPGSAAALIQPASGPGAVVMAAGALLLLVAALASRAVPRPLSRGGAAQLLLGASLLVAGWIHLLLAPEHVAESPVLGAGFIAAGMAQVLLAALSIARRADATLLAVVGVNAALLALYAWAVLVGLPIGGEAHEVHEAAAGLQLFAGEPIDLAGLANILTEGLALILAMRLLGGTRPVDPQATSL